MTSVISDFGGVLTSPLLDAFRRWQERSGISLEDLGGALTAVSEELGANPLFELETGRMSESDFLQRLGERLSRRLGHPVAMREFGEAYFDGLAPNARMIDYMRSLRARGVKLAICTNNVREWEPRWRAMLPVDEIFDVVVDSAFVGHRKPDRKIYELTLEQLGSQPHETLMVDDVEINCEAARELGIRAVHFRDAEQAIAEIEASLGA